MTASYVLRKSVVKRSLRSSAWGDDFRHAITAGVTKSSRPTFIKQWRAFRGLTQAQLADATGLTDATISRIESGKISYTQDTLERISQALAVEPADLLGYDPNSATPLWSLWTKADDDEKRQINALAETVVRWRPPRS